jgi:hypothetical protein
MRDGDDRRAGTWRRVIAVFIHGIRDRTRPRRPHERAFATDETRQLPMRERWLLLLVRGSADSLLASPPSDLDRCAQAGCIDLELGKGESHQVLRPLLYQGE